MDEIIIFICLILLIIYGFILRYTGIPESGKEVVEKTENSIRLNRYLSSKILLVGETGLFFLLLSILFHQLKFYLILLWGVISFLITIQSFSAAEKILQKKP